VPRNPVIAHVAQDRLFEEADFVVCLASASAQTHNLMDEAAFVRMRPGACFVNASGGELVDEVALLAAPGPRPPGGACALDVGRAVDQMPSPALARHPRVVARRTSAG
jgi:D-3-phosphoglycerate dehydrogenase